MLSTERPLDGVKVLEMSAYVAAPTCAKVLADWGADVIKIEPPKGDVYRYLGTTLYAPIKEDENVFFALANANKRFLSLNLKEKKGDEIVRRILKNVDVFVTNYRPEALKSLGLDYESLKELNPGLVFVASLGYGNKGPLRGKAGFDLTTYYARGGLLGGLSDNSGAMAQIVPGFGDNQLAMNMAAGVCAALYKKAKTGKGDYVSSSLYHTAIFAFSPAIVTAQYKQLYPTCHQNPLSPFINSYKCKDGLWIMIGGSDYNGYFKNIMTVLGLQQYLEDETVNNIHAMLENKERIVGILDAAFAQKDRCQWEELLNQADIPNELIFDYNDILEDEQAWANDYLCSLTNKQGEKFTMVNSPVNFESMGYAPMQHPGKLGENSVQVLQELGYGEDEIAALLQDKIVIA